MGFFDKLKQSMGKSDAPKAAKNAAQPAFTLDICGGKQVANPTEQVIRSAVMALDTSNDDAFLILSSSDDRFIQTSGDAATGFDLEYRDEKGQHRAKRDFVADEVMQIFTAYMAGQTNWKDGTEWEPANS